MGKRARGVWFVLGSLDVRVVVGGGEGLGVVVAIAGGGNFKTVSTVRIRWSDRVPTGSSNCQRGLFRPKCNMSMMDRGGGKSFPTRRI